MDYEESTIRYKGRDAGGDDCSQPQQAAEDGMHESLAVDDSVRGSYVPQAKAAGQRGQIGDWRADA